MGGGRVKKSRKTTNLRGNPGKRGKNKKRTFAATGGYFDTPRGLNQEVRTKCKQLARRLEANGVDVDFLRATFERYCKHMQAAHLAYKEIKKYGPITYTGFKVFKRKKVAIGAKKHPAAQVWKDNSDAALKLEQYFFRVMRDTEPPADDKKSPLEQFMSGGSKLTAVPGGKK